MEKVVQGQLLDQVRVRNESLQYGKSAIFTGDEVEQFNDLILCEATLMLPGTDGTAFIGFKRERIDGIQPALKGLF